MAVSDPEQQMDDLYKRLGLTPKATQREIRSAYRRRARAQHPDVSRSPDAAEAFARLAEAYRILSDPQRRARYDRGEPVEAPSAVFYSQNRQQVVAFQRKINRIVDELLEQDRQETRARGQAVAVLVTLFISTFVFALLKPLPFPVDLATWPLLVVVSALAIAGIWYVVRVLRRSFDRFTYSEEIPSVTHLIPAPDQPIERGRAVVWVTAGYTTCLFGGVLIDALSGGAIGGGMREDTMAGALLYPPRLAMVVDTVRRLAV